MTSSSRARPAQFDQQRLIDIEGGDRMPGTRQIKRHAAGPSSDVEHGTAMARRQRPPAREVLGVGTAFEVVPDHAHGRAPVSAAQNWFTSPRRASSSRRSSSAVYVGSA